VIGTAPSEALTGAVASQHGGGHDQVRTLDADPPSQEEEAQWRLPFTW
jgi:hypothetical protein